jgi:hypothetical protein
MVTEEITFQTPECGYRNPQPDGKVACRYHSTCPQKYDNYDQRFGIGYWKSCKFESGQNDPIESPKGARTAEGL